MKRVILVSGKKQVGKNYCANILKNHLTDFAGTVDFYAFADPIKTIIKTTLGIDDDELEHMKVNNTPINLETGHGFKTLTMRDFMQRFGTDAMQSMFGADVWKQKAIEFIEASDADYIIITDFRFKTEHIEGAVSFEVINYDADVNADAHISENGLGDHVFDFSIDNTNHPSISEIRTQFEYHSHLIEVA